MRKFSLAALAALCLNFGSLFAQKNSPSDSVYVAKKIKIEEVNLVSAYYTQNGNHSAVTGGIGTEKLTDFSNTFDISISRKSTLTRKHTFGLEMGIDHYTSASSDQIDPRVKVGKNGEIRTSASYSDQRFYPSVNYKSENTENGLSVGGGLAFSTEWDYQSRGATFSLNKSSKNNNSDIGIKFGAFLDTWQVILPVELRGNGDRDAAQPRNSFSTSINWSRIVNRRFQVGIMFEPNYQKGLLATKYQRVYFTDGTVQSENLPGQRWKFPIGIRASYFLGDHLILRPFYRFYADNWNLKSHTISLESVLKLSPGLSVSPFYRYYIQKGVPYFNEYGTTELGTTYFTSDYDLANLNSHHFGTGVRWIPQKSILGSNLIALELRYAHYIRTPDLKSNIISLGIKVKP